MPIVDTVALFAAAEPSDRFHGKATAQLRRLGNGLLLGTFALMEFDVVLRSRGFSARTRREEMTLLALDFPGAVASVHPVTPKTLYLAALYEEEFALGYFDSSSRPRRRSTTAPSSLRTGNLTGSPACEGCRWIRIL